MPFYFYLDFGRIIYFGMKNFICRILFLYLSV